MYIDLYYNVLEKLSQLSETNKHVEPEDGVQEHAIVGMALPLGHSPETINNKSNKKKKKKKRKKSPTDHL